MRFIEVNWKNQKFFFWIDNHLNHHVLSTFRICMLYVCCMYVDISNRFISSILNKHFNAKHYFNNPSYWVICRRKAEAKTNELERKNCKNPSRIQRTVSNHIQRKDNFNSHDDDPKHSSIQVFKFSSIQCNVKAQVEFKERTISSRIQRKDNFKSHDDTPKYWM